MGLGRRRDTTRRFSEMDVLWGPAASQQAEGRQRKGTKDPGEAKWTRGPIAAVTGW